MKGHRVGRLSEEIKRIVGGMLLTDIKDPRISEAMISITGVEVSSDGSYATCYISVMPTNKERTEEEIINDVLEGLKSATGLIRQEIGKKIKLRRTPEISFKIDGSMEYGRRIDEILSGLDIKPEEREENE